MLKGWLGKKDGDPPRPASADAQYGLDAERLRTLIDFFPIGKKLQYFPEFKKDIIFETLIVGYGVNGEFVYSSEAVERDGDGHPVAFRLPAGLHVPMANLRLFQLLVPDTSAMERQLDYVRRAEIGNRGQFVRGNYITLTSNAGTRGTSMVDTVVERHVELDSGPYAYTRLIVLTPEFNTLEVSDQRRKPRAKTNVPVMLYMRREGLSAHGVITDISDEHLRIHAAEGDVLPLNVAAGAELALALDLGDAGARYLLRGRVVRRSPDSCLIHLEGMLDEDRLKRFGPLDLLQLKAGLLNYSGGSVT